MSAALDDARFELSSNGRFRQRVGPRGPRVAHSSKKVCLVATHANFLVDLLYGISQRDDCYYVKYGLVVRDGMVLGRCFMSSDAAAAKLCEALKGHPRLMVSVQDDDFFKPFRTSSAPSGVWDELDDEDVAAVARVHEQAFGRNDEALMVASVRATRVGIVSLVVGAKAEAPDPRWQIVGHVLLSPVTVEGQAEPRGLGLAPLAVLPSYQRQGFGAALVQAALERARLLGTGYVVVLGDPAYHGRFGFTPAARFGLTYRPEYPAGADPEFHAAWAYGEAGIG
jgi:putative acetyltransferase